MESSRILTILLIGLILAGLVVGYFLLKNTFLSKPGTQTQVNQATKVSSPQPTPSNSVLGQNIQNTQNIQNPPTFSPTPPSAYSQIAARTQGNTSTLPNTGFPLALIGIFSASAMILGLRLRKYPH